MSMFPTKVLLGVDGSEEALRAARAGVELSRETDSDLHVVYVAAFPSILYAPEYQEQARNMLAEREGRETLDEQLAKVEEMGGEVSEAHLRIGRPDEEIVVLGEEIGAGLLVVGSRGMGALRRALIGSVSESVVRHAHCPVLVTRARGEDTGFLDGRILVAIDGSEEAKLAVRAATELADTTGAELHVVYALPTEPPMPYPYPYARERWEISLEQAKKKGREFVEEQAGHIGSDSGVPAQAHFRLGRPDREIVRLGEELGAGLIVVGSRGMGALRRALMGGVSSSVVRHAHSPVLVMRR